MGSIKVKNLLLSKKLKRSETRILIIDDNQIRFNEIENIFKAQTHSVKALLLDDIKNFEKQLNQHWDPREQPQELPRICHSEHLQ